MTASVARTLTFTLGLPDDGALVTTPATFATGTGLTIARASSGTVTSYGALRFVTKAADTILGQGCTIQSAIINASMFPIVGTGSVIIKGHLADNPSAYANKAAVDAAIASATTASVTLALTATTVDVDVTAIVQELVNQATFASGECLPFTFQPLSSGSDYTGLFGANSLTVTVAYDNPTYIHTPYVVRTTESVAIRAGNAVTVWIGDSTSAPNVGVTGHQGIPWGALGAGRYAGWTPTLWGGTYCHVFSGTFHSGGSGVQSGVQADEVSVVQPIRDVTQVPPYGGTPLGLYSRGLTRNLGATVTTGLVRYDFRWNLQPTAVGGTEAGGSAAYRQIMASNGVGCRLRMPIWRNGTTSDPPSVNIQFLRGATYATATTNVTTINVAQAAWVNSNGGTGPRWEDIIVDFDVETAVRTTGGAPCLRAVVFLPADAADKTIHLSGAWLERNDNTGLKLISVADGGDTALDHLRTEPGAGVHTDKGYSDLGMIEFLRPFVNGRMLVPMIAVGIQREADETAGDGSVTQTWIDRLGLLVDRWRTIGAGAAASSTKPIIINPFNFSNSAAGVFMTSRAEAVRDVATAKSCSYIDLFQLMGQSIPSTGGKFNDSWFLSGADAHLSGESSTDFTATRSDAMAGASRAAQEMWAAFGDPSSEGDPGGHGGYLGFALRVNRHYPNPREVV